MATAAEQVRQLLGEEVPIDGSDTDTLFLDAQIDDLISSTSSVDAAVAQGWRIKAAKFADLVDTAEGTSKRAMSDLHKNALAMAKTFSEGSILTGDRTRIHKLTRT